MADLSFKEKETIIDKYLNQDIRVLDLCVEYGVGKDALFGWLKKEGITTQKKKAHLEMRKNLSNDYLSQQYSLEELSSMYNTSVSAIRTYLTKNGLFKPAISQKERTYDKKAVIGFEGLLKTDRNNRISYDKVFLNWCKENSKRYQSLNDFAKKLGVSMNGLKRILDENNIVCKFDTSLNKNSVDFVAPYQDKDWLVERFAIERKTIREVSEEYGYSERVLQKWRSIHKEYIDERIYGPSPKKLEKALVEKVFKGEETKEKISDRVTILQSKLLKASMLGDGHITNSKYIPIFIISHAENQKDYLYWKYEILKDLCNLPPKKYEGGKGMKDGREYNKQPSYRINTRKLSSLEPIRDMSKSELIEQLDEFQLSVYLLDDGNRNKVHWSLSIAGLSEREKKLLKDTLFNKFGIDSRVKLDKKTLYIPARFRNQIDDMILNNIPNNLDVVKYKILDQKGGN